MALTNFRASDMRRSPEPAPVAPKKKRRSKASSSEPTTATVVFDNVVDTPSVPEEDVSDTSDSE